MNYSDNKRFGCFHSKKRDDLEVQMAKACKLLNILIYHLKVLALAANHSTDYFSTVGYKIKKKSK